MKNHFLMFEDETAARVTLPEYGTEYEGEWVWNGNVLPNQRVILARAQWDYSDVDNPVLVSPEQIIPGYYTTVTLPKINEALRDLPNAACRLIHDGNTGNFDYLADDLDQSLIGSVIIEPIWSGGNYDMGNNT